MLLTVTTATVLFRTTFTRTIKLNLPFKCLLLSNLRSCFFQVKHHPAGRCSPGIKILHEEMFADQLLVSTGQELTTMKLQTYPTNSSLRKQPFCETSPAARSEEKRLFSQATPTAHAASHNIIMSVLTMRISTLTPWMVVRNFCESKSAPSLEGKRKLSKSPRIILGKSTFAPYECSHSCDSH